MADEIIRVEGIEPLLRKIRSLEQLTPVVGALKAGAAHLAGKLQIYPTARHGRQAFKTAKQRRWFFWAMREGVIEVPYRRGSSPGSRNLKQSWTIQSLNDGMRQVVGTNAPYAPLVQDEQKQTLYHRQTGWQTIQAIAAREMTTVLEPVNMAIEKLLNE